MITPASVTVVKALAWDAEVQGSTGGQIQMSVFEISLPGVMGSLSGRTGWPGVSVLWLDDIAGLLGSVFPIVAACQICFGCAKSA